MSAPIRLYRWFDADGQLLYVGITNSPVGRVADHLKSSRWAKWAVRAEIDPTAYKDHGEASSFEAHAIINERPIFNTQGSRDGALDRVNAYLIAHGEAPVPPRRKLNGRQKLEVDRDLFRRRLDAVRLIAEAGGGTEIMAEIDSVIADFGVANITEEAS